MSFQLTKIASLVLLLSAWLLLATRADAQQPVDKPLSQEISELSSGSYEQRERASERLLEAGTPAVPLLESAVDGEQFESRVRALRVLQQIYEANDFAASFAAGDALRRLALHQQQMVSMFAQDALQAQRGLAVERLKDHGAVFQSEGTIIVLGEDWVGTDDDLIDLRWLDNLKTLRLSNKELGDRALEPLRWLDRLSELVIFDAQITDAGLVHLRHVPDLKILHLARTQITDAGMPRLTHLGSLVFLDLSRTNVTELGLGQLHHLKALRQIDLRHVELSHAAIAKLREQLPNTTVLAD